MIGVALLGRPLWPEEQIPGPARATATYIRIDGRPWNPCDKEALERLMLQGDTTVLGVASGSVSSGADTYMVEIEERLEAGLTVWRWKCEIAIREFVDTSGESIRLCVPKSVQSLPQDIRSTIEETQCGTHLSLEGPSIVDSEAIIWTSGRTLLGRGEILTSPPEPPATLAVLIYGYRFLRLRHYRVPLPVHDPCTESAARPTQ